MPRALLIRRETFSASHRLLSKDLSDAENEALFGKCFHPNGHGHNYVLKVSVHGDIDPKTGIVMNLTDLKKIIQDKVMTKVDHRHLNLDVEEFKSLNPSAENIAYVIWQWLKPALGDLLYEIELFETENNIAIYRGE